MQTLVQEFETTPIEAVRPHPRNPRRGDVTAIARSIERNGWYGAIICQRSTGYILAGNHRYQAAVKSGAQSVPVCWIDIDDERALRILLADNRTSDLASNSEEDLALLLGELVGSSDGLAGTGYSEIDLEGLLGEEDASAFDQSGELTPGFEVIVTCDDESQQRELLDRLQREGFTCRALAS